MRAVGRGLNRATLIGHLGRAPEMRYTWLSSDGHRHEDKDWFSVVAWGELAETCKDSLTRGQRVYVEGRVKTRQWVDDADENRAWAEIVAQDVVALETA